MEYEKLLDSIYEKLPNTEIASGERFEMPTFEFFTEGNKTIIKNFKTVCDKIRRKPETLAKYLSKELAVPVDIQGERLVLQRKIMKDALNTKLTDFIRKYVICKQCNRPDTRIEEVAHRLKNLICEACGARSAVR